MNPHPWPDPGRGVAVEVWPPPTQRVSPSSIQVVAGHTWWGSVPGSPPGED